MKNQFFEFEAWVKMLDFDGNPATNIDPDDRWYHNKSPILNLNERRYRDVATKKYVYTSEDRDQAVMARPYKSDGYNLVHGIFRLPEAIRLFVEIERAPDNVEFHVDNVSLTPMKCNPNELILNGNMEEGNTKYWDQWGDRVGLDLVPGYGGVGNALKGFQREHYSHGQAQVVNFDCLEGESLDARLCSVCSTESLLSRHQR